MFTTLKDMNMTNRINRFLFLLTATLVFSACYKDKGNYDYNDINEAQIEGIADEYTVALGEQFAITPVLKFSMDAGNDSSKYSYEWIALRRDGVLPGDVRKDLAVTRNLDLTITIPPGPYRAYYRITDKNSGVQWQKSFNLTVVSSIYEGWMLMNDVNGETRVDMISVDTTSYKTIIDVLGTTASGIPESIFGKPLFINCYPYDPTFYGVYIGTDKGTTKIHPETFKYDFTYNIKYEFVSNIPENFAVDYMTNLGGNTAWMHGTDNNVYYYYRIFQLKYGLPVNHVKNEVASFKANKHIATNGSSSAVLYDDDNRRFVRHINNEATSTLMPEGTLFDFNTGKDLVYMTYSAYNGGEVFAILNDPADSKYWLARFTFGASIAQVYYEEMSAIDIENAGNFAVSPEFGYIMYNAGNKLYSYDFNNKASKLMLDYGARNISLLKFHHFLLGKYAELRNQLIVCSNEEGNTASSGKMELFRVKPVQGDFELTNQYTGLGKIVSLSYRER